MLVSPAGPSPNSKIEAAVARCEAFGLEPVLGDSAALRDGYLAGSDDERAADFQRAIDDRSIDAIWAIRGGYGTMRILPRLRLEMLRRNPKAFLGFSDNTAIHLVFYSRGLTSFHAPHAGGAFPRFTEDAFRRVLFHQEPAGELPLPENAPAPVTLFGGRAEGALIGGNLALLAACCGTTFAPETAGRILFLEDVGEAVYRIDRLLMQLKLTGAINGVAGIAIGHFTEIPKMRGDLPLERVIREWAAPLKVPVVMGLPIGHVDEQWTLPVGARARLDADRGTLEIIERAVR